MKTLYKNPLFKNLSSYPGGIHKIQDASTLRRTLGYPRFWGQVLIFWGSFPHQGNLESTTKFPSPPHQQTLCLSIMSVCWLDTARHALLVSCRLGLQPHGCGNLELKFSKPAASCSACAAALQCRACPAMPLHTLANEAKCPALKTPGHVPKVERSRWRRKQGLILFSIGN